MRGDRRGVLAILATPREEEPQISVPMIDVIAALPGAAPEEAENLLARPIEQRMLELTAEGRTLAKSATAALNTEVFGQSGFANQDVDQLIRILGKFRRNAGDFSD
jgi:Cu/Ag efflux pump CusA